MYNPYFKFEDVKDELERIDLDTLRTESSSKLNFIYNINSLCVEKYHLCSNAFSQEDGEFVSRLLYPLKNFGEIRAVSLNSLYRQLEIEIAMKEYILAQERILLRYNKTTGLLVRLNDLRNKFRNRPTSFDELDINYEALSFDMGVSLFRHAPCLFTESFFSLAEAGLINSLRLETAGFFTILEDFTFVDSSLELGHIYLEPTLELLSKLNVSVCGGGRLD